jgi:hypothetical protein
VTLPVTLAFSVLLGMWLMFAPAGGNGTATAANGDRLVGALIVTVAAISTAEVVRAFRFINLLLALWLVVAPWALEGSTSAMMWSDTASGVVLVALTWPRGTVRERYGAWDRWIL